MSAFAEQDREDYLLETWERWVDLAWERHMAEERRRAAQEGTR